MKTITIILLLILVSAAFSLNMYNSTDQVTKTQYGIIVSTKPIYSEIFPNQTSTQWYYLKTPDVGGINHKMNKTNVQSALTMYNLKTYLVSDAQHWNEQIIEPVWNPNTQQFENTSVTKARTNWTYAPVENVTRNTEYLISLDVPAFQAGFWEYVSAMINFDPDITGCGIISAPGVYVQTANFTGSGAYCIQITGDNVTYDGNGNWISGGATNAIGVVGATGVVIRNVNVSGDVGVYVVSNGKANITNSNLNSLVTAGIQVDAGSAANITWSNFSTDSNINQIVYSGLGSHIIMGNTQKTQTTGGNCILFTATDMNITQNLCNSTLAVGIFPSSAAATNSYIYNNTIQAKTWTGNNAGSGNMFNVSGMGNKYYFGGNSSGAWNTFNITTSNPPGWATAGSDRPFNFTTVTSNFTTTGEDWFPWTTNIVTDSCGTLTANKTLVANVTIDGATCLTVTAANVEINCAGFSITGNNTTSTYGVYSNQLNTTVQNCIISHFHKGIMFEAGSNNGRIINNTVNETIQNALQPIAIGVLTASGNISNILIANNTIHDSSTSSGNNDYGIVFYSSVRGRNINVTNNTVNKTAGAQTYSSGISVQNVDGARVVGNNVWVNSTSAIVTYQTDNTLYANNTITSTSNGITVTFNSHNNTFTNNTVSSNTGYGFNISGGANNTIDCQGASITGNNTTNTYGIYSTQLNTTVKNCIISNFSTGIYYNGATKGLIQNTSISSSSGATISFAASANYNSIINTSGSSTTGHSLNLNVVSYNNIINSSFTATSGMGMYALSSSYNNFTNSAFTSNTNYAVQFWTQGRANFINTTFTSTSGSGINLHYGVSNKLINSTVSSAGTGIYLTGTANDNNFTNVSIPIQGNGHGISITGGVNNLIDCQGASITGNNTTATYGVFSDQFNTTIQNCIISNFQTAVYFSGADNGLIQNTSATTTFSGGARGIYIYNGANNNRIINTSAISYGGQGVLIQTSSLNNSIINSSVASYVNNGIYVLSASDNTNITNTSVSSSVMSAISNEGGANLHVDCMGAGITGTNTTATYGIYSDQFNTTIKNCLISNFTDAIRFNGADSGNITNNTLSTTRSGGYALNILAAAENNSIANNTLNASGSATTAAIFSATSQNNTFLQNNITATVWVNDTNGTNSYNNSNSGNIYHFANGTGAWQVAPNGTALTYTTPQYWSNSGVCINTTTFGQTWVGVGVGDCHAYTENLGVTDFINITALNLTPTNPTIFTDLIANITAIGSNSSFNGSLYWFKNGINQTGLATTFTGLLNNTNTEIAILGAGNLSYDDNWSFAVWLQNGTTNSTLNYSANVTIASNSIPVVSDVNIIPTTAYTTDTLEGYAKATDDYNSSIILFYKWYMNGTANFTGNVSVVNNTNTSIFNITSGNLSTGQNWTLQITPFDGTVNGTPVNSSNVTILSNPSFINASITVYPETGYYTNNLGCFVDINSSDELFNITITFYNQNYTALSTTFSFVNQTTNTTYLYADLVSSGTYLPYEGVMCSAFIETNTTNTSVNSTFVLITQNPAGGGGSSSITPAMLANATIIVSQQPYSVYACRVLFKDQTLSILSFIGLLAAFVVSFKWQYRKASEGKKEQNKYKQHVKYVLLLALLLFPFIAMCIEITSILNNELLMKIAQPMSIEQLSIIVAYGIKYIHLLLLGEFALFAVALFLDGAFSRFLRWIIAAVFILTFVVNIGLM